ncbi:MAG: hypothetical protein KAQ92_09170, partial [Candidatus Aenigmarchaeota archaeon]|nr:hypothetical protein [Candidatus Aenigmarchaeota archaeon]
MKRKYFVVVLLISIILSCGCFDAEAEKEQSYNCDTMLDGDSKDLCYIVKAIAKNDVYSCDKINNYYKEECYTF